MLYKKTYYKKKTNNKKTHKGNGSCFEYIDCRNSFLQDLGDCGKDNWEASNCLIRTYMYHSNVHTFQSSVTYTKPTLGFITMYSSDVQEW